MLLKIQRHRNTNELRQADVVLQLESNIAATLFYFSAVNVALGLIILALATWVSCSLFFVSSDYKT